MDSNMTSRSASPCLDSSASTAPSTPPEIPSVTPAVTTHSYSQWRPSYHVMPRSGWMNDPCAPGYNRETGEYFVSFQWNPHGPDWDDICWGTAFSKDLLDWTVLETPTLEPDTQYDGSGIFTGCVIPGTGETGQPLTIAYTSVNQIPIHHTLPRLRGSESLSLATSHDAGRTWTKAPTNPVLPHEPHHLDVTAWRDPFVAPWISMARTLGLDDSTLFGIISGGIRNVTPTSFLYTISPSDLARWNYIGPLAKVGLNARLSRWSGDMGLNWEVTNFVTLTGDDEPSVKREYLIMGTEGCLSAESNSLYKPLTSPSRPPRAQLWMSGNLQRPTPSEADDPASSPINISYEYGGRLDHGCFYAANSFFDPLSNRQIVWGWITEDDLCDEFRHEQGWSGLLSLPRELRMQTIRHAARACNSAPQELTNIECEPDEYGTYTVRTLGSEPAHRVRELLRCAPGVRFSSLTPTVLNARNLGTHFTSNDIRTTQWNLQASLSLPPTSYKTGLRILHSRSQPSTSQNTTSIAFDLSTETLTILRPSSSLPTASINSSPEVAPHTLFTTRDPITKQEKQEDLELQIWRDNSVLEVFVNGRTAVSTRIYLENEKGGGGIQFFAEGADEVDGKVDGALLVEAKVWDGIGTNAVHDTNQLGRRATSAAHGIMTPT